MPRLFELTNAYLELEQLVDNQEANDVEIFKYLDDCGQALKEKIVDVSKFIKNLEATAGAIEIAEMKMGDRRKAIEGRIKSIKQYLLDNMQKADIHKIECEFFKISRQKNPPSVILDNQEAIDIRYWKQPEPPPPSIDKRAILDDIKNGVIVEGAHIEQTDRIVIK